MSERLREAVDGFLLLDKSPGLSSNLALQKAKRLLGAAKGGHTGSLDPIASGLLPICLGEATKLSGFLLHSDKRYRVEIRLGVQTTTADAEGDVIAIRPVPQLTAAAIESALAAFRGEIEQVPPMYSALKYGGQRLYELARRGIEVARAARPVTIFELWPLRFEAEYLELEVHCSKGTYIRSLATDLGDALGCGAHVTALRRTAVGDFSVERAVTLAELEARSLSERRAELLPADTIVGHLPEVRVNPDLAFFIQRGQAVFIPHAPTAGWLRLYARPATFLGLGEVLPDGRIAPRRLLRSPPQPAGGR